METDEVEVVAAPMSVFEHILAGGELIGSLGPDPVGKGRARGEGGSPARAYFWRSSGRGCPTGSGSMTGCGYGGGIDGINKYGCGCARGSGHPRDVEAEVG